MGLKHTVLILLLTTFSEGQYVVSPSAANCTLAQPTLTYDQGKITTDLTGVNINRVQSMFVGYFQADAIFEYIGCAATADLKNIYRDSSLWHAKNDPGSCFYFCGSYFGISGNTCICLPDYNETILQTEVNCTTGCLYSKGIACGGNNYFSLYSFYDKATSISASIPPSKDEQCLHSQPQNPTPVPLWRTCFQGGYHTLCYNSTMFFDLNTNQVANFTDAAIQCFKHILRLANFANSKPNLPLGGSLWTGVIRSEAIFNTSVPVNIPNVAIGVLKLIKNNSFELVFQNNNHGVMNYLCTQDGTTHATAETSSTPTSPSHVPTTTSSTVNSVPTVTSSIGTGEITITNATNTPKTNDGKSSSDVGIAVGISVTVVVIVVAAVTVCVVLRRRILKTQTNDMEIKKSNIREENPNEYAEIPEIKHTNGNSRLFSKEDGHDNYAHTYHVLEKDRKTEGEINTSHRQDPNIESHNSNTDTNGFIQEKGKDQTTDIDNGQYAHTYFVLEEQQNEVDFVDGTYNLTGAHTSGNETDNVYNKLQDSNNSTYDHLSKHVPGFASKRQGSDNIFGSKENAKPGEEPDSVYNQVSGVEESGTYDHVNNVASGAKEADNVYGVPKKS